MVDERPKFSQDVRARQTPKRSAGFNLLSERAINSMSRGAGLAAVESFKPLCQKLSPNEKQEYRQLLNERKKTLDHLVSTGHLLKTDKNYVAALGDIEKLLRYLDEPEAGATK